MRQTTIPAGSKLNRYLHGADFVDCFWAEEAGPAKTAMETYLDLVARTPRWVDGLMALRNRFVRLFGLKDLGLLGAVDPMKPAASYRIGDRVGIFSVTYISDDEVVLLDSDKHLDVRVSLQVRISDGKTGVAVSTVVHVHNALGRIYIALVEPFHKLIVPATLSQLGGGPEN